jgi:hypothetical protein
MYCRNCGREVAMNDLCCKVCGEGIKSNLEIISKINEKNDQIGNIALIFASLAFLFPLDFVIKGSVLDKLFGMFQNCSIIFLITILCSLGLIVLSFSITALILRIKYKNIRFRNLVLILSLFGIKEGAILTYVFIVYIFSYYILI